MSEKYASPQRVESHRLPFWTKVVYGSGDWGMASYGTLRQIFYAIFLTDVVGLDARLASIAALVGVAWDAINDPLVGALSDRVHTRWGRRRPFFLLAAIPFSFAFVLLWWAPPWQTQLQLLIHVSLAFMLSDTIQTLIIVPFLAMTPELTPDYDERTSLTGYRMVFNLIASLLTAVAAPMIQDAMIKAGSTAQQGYLLTAVLFGGSAAVPFLIMFFALREKDAVERPPTRAWPGLKEIVRSLWANVPFRTASLLYMLNWITFDLVALMIPFFLLYWVAAGDLLASVELFGIELSLESAVLGVLLVVAMLAVPLWTWLSRRLTKQTAYILGMVFWIGVQLRIFGIQPGQTDLILVLAVLAGLSVSTAHVLPEAIFPDVIEWDELISRQRREGMYYGAKNFIRKLTGALAIFLALQVLGWFGYQSPSAGSTHFTQSHRTLVAIRWLTSPAGALFLLSSVLVARVHPLTRAKHARIRRLLAIRETRLRTRRGSTRE